MIKIISDSTSYMTKEYAEKHDISIIPLRVLYQDTEFEEGFPGTFDKFFDDFTKTKIFPKTSQPSLEHFTEEINKAIDNGDEVIIFTISSTVSGTYSAANLAKNQSKDPSKVYVFDSMALAQTIWGYIMEAVNMRDAGKTCQEIIERLEILRENSQIVFVPDTLEYIYKGGRIGKVTATLGSILQIKPIVYFKKGDLKNKNSFGMQRAMRDMIAMIPQPHKLKRLFILHIANSTLYETWKNMLYKHIESREDKDEIEIYEGEVGPVVSTHAGPAVGMAWTTE